MKPDNFTKITLTIIALLVGAVVFRPMVNPIDSVSAQSQHAQSPASPKVSPESQSTLWEYKELSMDRDLKPGFAYLSDYVISEDGRDLPDANLLAEANRLGAQGWELVSVSTSSNLRGAGYAGATSGALFMFKRQKH